MDSSLVSRFGAITADQVAALDAASLETGITIEQLMEAAGIQVARLAWRMVNRRPRRVHVVAGRGHNGGDGLVAARHLASWGCPTSVTVVAAADGLDALLARQCTAAAGAGVRLRFDPSAAAVTEPDAALTVDALLGTGFRAPLREVTARAIAAIAGRVLSIDVPSALDATTGQVTGTGVRATATCTLAAVKRGFWEPSAAPFLGRVHLADIGIPPAAWARCGLARPTATLAGDIRRVPMPAAGAVTPATPAALT